MNNLKFVSWNVNGLRAILGKGFADIFKDFDADFVCLQEIKLQEGQHDFAPEGYHAFYSYADRKGYSGTAVFSRQEPLRCIHCMGIDLHDHEGRIVALEFEKFFLVNVYVPNSQDGLARLSYRMQWEDDFRAFLGDLAKEKPVVVCGDLNVAHQEIDLANPKTNRKNPGFTDEERGKMTELLGSGFIDTFRLLHPDEKGAYSWWSYRGRARERNVGWRIDYFLVSQDLKEAVRSAKIHPAIVGSDHCPVSLELDI